MEEAVAKHSRPLFLCAPLVLRAGPQPRLLCSCRFGDDSATWLVMEEAVAKHSRPLFSLCAPLVLRAGPSPACCELAEAWR
jgi:hypothetical protein